MWAVFIALLVGCHVFPESFLAFLTYEGHFHRFLQRMLGYFGMTLRAVEPLLAARSTNRDLGIQDMFAVSSRKGYFDFISENEILPKVDGLFGDVPHVVSV